MKFTMLDVRFVLITLDSWQDECCEHEGRKRKEESRGDRLILSVPAFGISRI